MNNDRLKNGVILAVLVSIFVLFSLVFKLGASLRETSADQTRFQAYMWESMIDSDEDESKRNDIRALMRKREFSGHLGYMSQNYSYYIQVDEYPDDQFRILDELEVRIRTDFLGKNVRLSVVPDWRYQYVAEQKYWIVTQIEIAP